MMERKEDEEKEIVMNDPQPCAVIEKLADGTRLSLEEYYDQFDAMLKEPPEIFGKNLLMNLYNNQKQNQKNDENY